MEQEIVPDKKRKKLWLIFFGIGVSFFLLFVLDLFLGFFLFKIGYFKAMNPNHNILYDTYEFTMPVSLSSQGLRNQFVDPHKPKNIYRILALGDSFTFGWGVNLQDTWVKQLEKSAQILGKKVEVINGGAIGIFLDKEVDVCKVYADYLQADAVVVGLYAGDDFNQSVDYKNFQDNYETVWEKMWPHIFSLKERIIAPFGEPNQNLPRSITVSSIWKKMAPAFLDAHPDLLDNIDQDLQKQYFSGKINPFLFSSVYTERDKNYYNRIVSPSYFSDSINAYAQGLKRLKNECTGKLPVIIVTLPSADQVTDIYYPIRTQFGYNPDKKLLALDLDTPLKKIVSKEGFGYISLLASFRKDGCPDCYYPIDTHFTKKGNSRAAEEIGPFISNFLRKYK